MQARKEGVHSWLTDAREVIVTITEEKTLVSLQKFVNSAAPERIRVLTVLIVHSRVQMYDGIKSTTDIIVFTHNDAIGLQSFHPLSLRASRIRMLAASSRRSLFILVGIG